MKKHRMFLLVLATVSVLASGCGQQGKAENTENKAEDKTKIENENKNKTETKNENAEEAAKVRIDREVKGSSATRDPENEAGSDARKEETEQPALSNETVLDGLQAQLDGLLLERRNAGESWSVYAERLSDGASVCSGNQSLESASLIKLYIAAAAESIHGELEGQEAYPGETDMLLQNMISASDNTATNTLIQRIGGGDAAAGMERINVFCREHSFHETHIGRLMLDFESSDDNYTSPRDCAALLKCFYNGQLSGSEQIIGFMKAQERTGKIPAGLPSGTVCANKTGELEDVENDAAIVFSDTGDYTVCIMSNQLTDPANARNLFITLSEMIYQAMSSE